MSIYTSGQGSWRVCLYGKDMPVWVYVKVCIYVFESLFPPFKQNRIHTRAHTHIHTQQVRSLFSRHSGQQHDSYIMQRQSGDEDTEADASPRTVRPSQTQTSPSRGEDRQTHKMRQTSHSKQTNVPNPQSAPSNTRDTRGTHHGKSHTQNVADDSLSLSLNKGANRDMASYVGDRVVRFGGGMRTLSEAYEYVLRPMEVGKDHEGQYVFVLKSAGK